MRRPTTSAAAAAAAAAACCGFLPPPLDMFCEWRMKSRRFGYLRHVLRDYRVGAVGARVVRHARAERRGCLGPHGV